MLCKLRNMFKPAARPVQDSGVLEFDIDDAELFDLSQNIPAFYHGNLIDDFFARLSKILSMEHRDTSVPFHLRGEHGEITRNILVSFFEQTGYRPADMREDFRLMPKELRALRFEASEQYDSNASVATIYRSARAAAINKAHVVIVHHDNDNIIGGTGMPDRAVAAPK